MRQNSVKNPVQVFVAYRKVRNLSLRVCSFMGLLNSGRGSHAFGSTVLRVADRWRDMTGANAAGQACSRW